MKHSTPSLKDLRIGALLNTSSGSCDEGCEQQVLDLLEAADCKIHQMWCGTGDTVAGALEEIAGAGLDVLIVLGGDGTIRSAAETCDKDGPFLIPLPGGTMNMLPSALYGDVTWPEALAATLSSPSVQPVNSGRIGDMRFYCAAIFGDPSRWAEVREAIREGDVSKATEQGIEAVSKAFGRGLDYQFDDLSGQAEAVAVVCPLASRALEDDDTVLEAVVIDPEGPLDALKLAARALVSEWRSDPNVETARVRKVVVRSDQPIPAILDGETVELPAEVTVHFMRTAFRALVPSETAPAG
ncbi:diacylglycerol kinase family protein [uncultured Brevundimonas sp.]|uniref:diacylglycerol/lipid kinase family protein n=1 Tax=uncultured Brevundimonas sp. TaxID=213418 RepID=UPI0030ED117C